MSDGEGCPTSLPAVCGILWLPDELTLHRRGADLGADAWLDLITEAMTAPIRDLSEGWCQHGV